MAYTASSLLAYMETEIGPLLVPLGLDASDALAEGVTEVAAVLGVADISTVTDDLKLRTLARWQAWRAAKGAAAGEVDLKAGTTGLTQSQVWDHVTLMLADAEAAALRYDEVAAVLAGSSTASVSGMSTAGNPYAYRVCPEWG